MKDLTFGSVMPTEIWLQESVEDELINSMHSNYLRSQSDCCAFVDFPLWHLFYPLFHMSPTGLREKTALYSLMQLWIKTIKNFFSYYFL